MSLESAITSIVTDLRDLRSRLNLTSSPEIIDGGARTEGGNCLAWMRCRRGGEVFTGSLRGPCASMTGGAEGLAARLHALALRPDDELRSTFHLDLATAGDDDDGPEDARRIIDRSMMHHHDFALTRRPDGLWCACVSVPTNYGPLSFCASAHERDMMRAIEAAYTRGGATRRPRDGVMRQMAASIGQSVATDRAASAFSTFAKDPATAQAFGAASLIPGLGIAAMLTHGGMRLASDIIDRQRAGDPRAKAAIAKTAKKAARGDRKAIQKMRILRAVDAMKYAPGGGTLAFASSSRLFQGTPTSDKAIMQAAQTVEQAPIITPPMPPTSPYYDETYDEKPSWEETEEEAIFDGLEFAGADSSRRVARADYYRRGAWEHGRAVDPRVYSPEVGHTLARPRPADYYRDPMWQGGRATSPRVDSPEVGFVVESSGARRTGIKGALDDGLLRLTSGR